MGGGGRTRQGEQLIAWLGGGGAVWERLRPLLLPAAPSLALLEMLTPRLRLYQRDDQRRERDSRLAPTASVWRSQEPVAAECVVRSPRAQPENEAPLQ